MNRAKKNFSSWWKENYDKYSLILFDADGTLTSGGHALARSSRINQKDHIEELRKQIELPDFILKNL